MNEFSDSYQEALFYTNGLSLSSIPLLQVH